MSGRTVPRFALAGLLAAAFAAPAVAQESLPEAPMPRAKANIEIELSFGLLDGFDVGLTWSGPAVAPMPRAVRAEGPCCGAECCRKPAAVVPQSRRPDLRAYSAYDLPGNGTPQLVLAPPATCPTTGFMTGGLGAWQPVPCVVPAVAPPGGAFTVFGPGQLRVTGNAIELTTVAANTLLGTWYRDTGVGVVAATFTHDELKLCLSQREGANTVTFTITAHYTLTKDGLVYGAVTGADVDAKLDGKGEAGMELAELSLVLQELADRPFSFRAKATSAGLMVSQLKFASDGSGGKDYAVLGGLYKSAKGGVVPAPAPLKTTVGTGLTAPALVDMPLPPPPALPTMSEPIQRVGIDFTFNPPMTLPCPQRTCETAGGALNRVPQSAATPVPPRNDAMKSMAGDAFGQLLKQSADTATVAGMTLPSGRYLEHFPQYFAPDPAFPLPRELASQEDPDGAARRGAPAKPAHVGTWVRMIGSKQCVVKVEADHLTITVSEAHEFDGQTVTGHLTFTADYHTTRDGLTAVGLLTSVDVKFDGDLPEDDTQAMLEKIGELQKALEEKPFAMTFRRYGETLVIGNVRMPDAGDRMEAQPGTYIGGRYASVGDKPLPKLKVVKAPEPKVLPPIPAYNLPPPLPPYTGPGSELLPPQAVPCPAGPRPVEFVVPAPRQRVIVEESWSPPMTAPVPPTMVMPQPTPLALDATFPIARPTSFTGALEKHNSQRQLFNFFSVGVFGSQ